MDAMDFSPDRKYWFAGPKVLVVEDEAFIAMELELLLQDEGFRVMGPATSLDAALKIFAGERPDAAVLDIDLRGEKVTPLVEALRKSGVPFVVASASPLADIGMPEAMAGVENIGKPTEPRRLLKCLQSMLDKTASKRSSGCSRESAGR